MNNAQKYWRYLLSAGVTVHMLWISSVLIIFTLEQWLFQTPEWFFGAAALGKIVENVGFSIIASVIFYLIVVHIPQSIAQEGISEFIRKKSLNVVGSCKGLHTEFKKHLPKGSEEKLEYLSDAHLKIVFDILTPTTKAPLVLGNLGNLGNYANWLQYMMYFKTRSKGFMSDLLNVSQYIKPEHMHLLILIDDCSHFKNLDLTVNINNFAKTTLDPWCGLFQSYTKLCQDLELYMESIDRKR